MIKTASVIIAPVPMDYVYKDGDLAPGSTKFFFNSKDSGFIGFSHSIGWKKDSLTQYELVVVDPGDNFEKEFIATHYFNRSANNPLVSTSYSITYGIGDGIEDRSKWSHPQLAYIIKIDVDVRSNGARKYTLFFGSLPSLKNNPSSDGWALIDTWGRRLITSGKAPFLNEKLSDMFQKADAPGSQGIAKTTWIQEKNSAATRQGKNLDPHKGKARNKQGSPENQRPRLSKKGDGWTTEDWESGQYNDYLTRLTENKVNVAEDWISWLDAHTNKCIKNYIENITGLGPYAGAKSDAGNVIVLLPSFKYTRVMQNMHRVLSGDKLTGSANAQKPVPGRFMISPRHNPPYLINNYLFRDFSNLAAYNLTDQKQELMVVNTNRKLHHKNSIGELKEGVLVFQANNTDFMKDKDTGKNSRLDWVGVLDKFGKEFSEHIDSMSLNFRKANRYGYNIGAINRSTANFGFFEGVEIRDAKRLSILKREGLIGRTRDYCYIWGETNMIDLLLGQLAKGEELKAVRKVAPGAVILDPGKGIGTSLDRGAGLDGLAVALRTGKESEESVNVFWKDKDWYREVKSLFPPAYGWGLDDIGFVHHFVSEEDNLKEMGDSQVMQASKEPAIYATNSNVRALLHGSPATVVEIGEGNFVPVLRSNVKNANVLDLRLQMNPHYWNMLAGTVDAMIPEYNKRANEGMAGSVTGRAISFTIEDQILHRAGTAKDDPAFIAWLSKVKLEVKKLTLDKGLYGSQGRNERHRVQDSKILRGKGYSYPGEYGFNVGGTKGGPAERLSTGDITSRKGFTQARIGLGRSQSRARPGKPSKGNQFTKSFADLHGITQKGEQKKFGIEGSPLHEAIMAIPIPKSWKRDQGDSPTPESYDVMMHVMANYVVASREIYNKIKKDVAATDIFNQTQLFYEKVYRMAGAQLDVTTYPMFFYSRYADLGRSMYVLMRQPSIMRGIDPEIDDVALNKRTKKMYTDMGTGLLYSSL